MSGYGSGQRIVFLEPKVVVKWHLESIKLGLSDPSLI